MDLKVFEGFSLEMAAEFTGLRSHEIDWLRKTRVVTPLKRGHSFLYVFQDLLMLRLVRLLKMLGVRLRNVRKASDYLREFDASRKLTNLEIFIDKSKKTLLYLGEDPDPNLVVSLSEHGQIQGRPLIWILPIGRALEEMRRNVTRYDNTLSRRLKSKKVVPMEEVFRRYGIR